MNKIFLALEPILMAVADTIAFLVDGLASLFGATMSAITGTEDMTDSLVEQKKQVTLLEAELGLLQLQYQREAELMRQIRDDESLSIEERINAISWRHQIPLKNGQTTNGTKESNLDLQEFQLPEDLFKEVLPDSDISSASVFLNKYSLFGPLRYKSFNKTP